MMTKADRRLLVFLLLAGIFLLAWRAGSFSGGLPEAQEIQVVQEGREVLRLTLAGQEAERIPLTTLRGGPAYLEVANGAVRLCRPGDKPFCPQEICLATGWIKRPGETIICVPNRLVVRVISHTQTGEAAVDAVSR
jgi:hypothetical protein